MLVVYARYITNISLFKTAVLITQCSLGLCVCFLQGFEMFFYLRFSFKISITLIAANDVQITPPSSTRDPHQRKGTLIIHLGNFLPPLTTSRTTTSISRQWSEYKIWSGVIPVQKGCRCCLQFHIIKQTLVTSPNRGAYSGDIYYLYYPNGGYMRRGFPLTITPSDIALFYSASFKQEVSM